MCVFGDGHDHSESAESEDGAVAIGEQGDELTSSLLALSVLGEIAQELSESDNAEERAEGEALLAELESGEIAEAINGDDEDEDEDEDEEVAEHGC